MGQKSRILAQIVERARANGEQVVVPIPCRRDGGDGGLIRHGLALGQDECPAMRRRSAHDGFNAGQKLLRRLIGDQEHFFARNAPFEDGERPLFDVFCVDVKFCR